MDSPLQNSAVVPAALRPGRSGLSYALVSMAGDLSVLFDPLCLIAAALLVALPTSGPPPALAGFDAAVTVAVALAAALAAVMLHDPQFGARATHGRIAMLLRAHVLRFSALAAALLALGFVTGGLRDLPHGWLARWFTTALILTSVTRLLVAASLRWLQRRGTFTEVVAVVGTGPLADRLMQLLRQSRTQTIDLVGLFDAEGTARRGIGTSGTLAQLIEIGQSRRIDWIVLALPPADRAGQAATLQRLKALSVPIGLCPQNLGSAPAAQHGADPGDGLLLGWRGARREIVSGRTPDRKDRQRSRA